MQHESYPKFVKTVFSTLKNMHNVLNNVFETMVCSYISKVCTVTCKTVHFKYYYINFLPSCCTKCKLHSDMADCIHMVKSPQI